MTRAVRTLFYEGIPWPDSERLAPAIGTVSAAMVATSWEVYGYVLDISPLTGMVFVNYWTIPSGGVTYSTTIVVPILPP